MIKLFKKLTVLLLTLVAFQPAAVLAANNFQLNAQPGPNKGQVTLNWTADPNVPNFNVVYGTTPGQFLWGAPNLGKVTSFTVSSLNPGQKYAFALAPEGSAPYGGYVTDSVSAVAATANTGSVKPAPSQTAQVPAPQAPVVSKAMNGPVSAPWNFTAKTGPGKGQVTLSWMTPTNVNVTNFDLVYGQTAGTWLWGAQNVGKITSYTVNYLNPGGLYYFSLLPKIDGQTPQFSGTVSAFAGK